MSEPAPAEPGAEAPAPSADPTLRVDRPPVPGRAARAEMADGSRATPPIRVDEPTITVDGSSRTRRNRTLEFSAPAAVKVTVGPRVKPRRRHRTWPWILAVIVALIALGLTLLVMLLHGATLDSNAGGPASGNAGAAATSSVLDGRPWT
jgi:hypothetical protein